MPMDKPVALGFHRGEGGVIVHQIIRQEYLLPAAAAKIQRGEVVQRAGRANPANSQSFSLSQKRCVSLAGFVSRDFVSRGFGVTAEEGPPFGSWAMAYLAEAASHRITIRNVHHIPAEPFVSL